MMMRLVTMMKKFNFVLIVSNLFIDTDDDIGDCDNAVNG